ncbi:uncharacterized protein LOC113205272 isoform X1 [Frankliniella occidentalis]|uniref:Uncharacterized protein LOC113205272 isoform X1 n=1 Tax=Frankliniella occidentalis TaxID=133901 RepID=A0A6J1SDA0_FRAOC|nr:uncharacterized protein LOC113205272 isoform X1 [Frankliniella occidentalis]XP_026276611.1 uncharacterized protein LOC113205272 isoform X1 [Frankliniella occidentalis]
MGNSHVKKSQKGESQVTATRQQKRCTDKTTTMATNASGDLSDSSNFDLDLSDYLDIRTCSVLQPVAPRRKRKSLAMAVNHPETNSCLECSLESTTNSRTFPQLFEETDFCLVCGKFGLKSERSHQSTKNHIEIREFLLKRIYPYGCRECPLRFLCKHDLQNHGVFHKHSAFSRPVEFDPICCYLCLLPFQNSRYLQEHEQLEEHQQRKRMAMEMGQREAIGAKVVNFSVASTQTELQDSLKNIDKSTASLKEKSNDGSYFCFPCSVTVPKANVITHETGKNHKKSCETWVANSSQVANSVASTQTEQQESLKNIDKSTASLKASSNDGSYFCFPCSVNVPKANVITHQTGKNHKKCCETWVANSSQKSIQYHKSTELENSTKMTASEFSKMIGSFHEATILSSDKTNNLIKAQSEKSDFEHPMSDLEMVEPHKLELTPLNLASSPLNGEQTSSTAEVKNNDVSSIPNDPNESKCVPGVNGVKIFIKGKCITLEDIIEAVTEYFVIDGIVETRKKVPVSNFVCTKCNVACIMSNMISHMISKGHRGIAQNQTLNELEKKHEILAFLQLARDSHKLLKSMDFVTVEKTLQEIQNLIEAGNLAKAKMMGAKFDSASLPAISQPSYSSTVSESSQELEEVDVEGRVNLTDNIVIGNSNLGSLQEEVEQARQENDIDDFEMECGICGVVFLIFNDDVDFSFDKHIQDDPQHQLAIAVPVERDAKSMAEMSKTILTPVVNKAPINKLPNMRAVVTQGRSKVCEELLKVEQKFVSLGQDSYFTCKLCSVTKKKTLALHHLISREHLSDNWAGHFTDVELVQRSKFLYSLLKYKYAVTMLTSAIERIKKIVEDRSLSEFEQYRLNNAVGEQKVPVNTSKCNGSNVINVIKTAQVQQSLSFINSNHIYCEMCSLNISDLTSASRRKHRAQCRKIPMEKLTPVKSLSQASNSNKVNPVKPPKNIYFCDICQKSMSHNNKKSHISGKLHKSKIVVQPDSGQGKPVMP